MTLTNAVEKIVENYRQNPTLPATLSLERRQEIKAIIGAIASQKQLQKTLSNMRSAGYQENSPALRIFQDRLRVVETTLKNLEGTYGKITNLQYQT